MEALELLENTKCELNNINAEIARQMLQNSYDANDIETLNAAIEANINQLKVLKDTVTAGVTLNKENPIVVKKNSPEYINKRRKNGIENCGAYTGDDFKTFCKEFKVMMQAELKKVGAEKYQQSNGHYSLFGYFTLGDQPYYISLSDVRYFPDDYLLIRTAENYKDYHGGTNYHIAIETDMFVDFFKSKGGL